MCGELPSQPKWVELPLKTSMPPAHLPRTQLKASRTVDQKGPLVVQIRNQASSHCCEPQARPYRFKGRFRSYICCEDCELGLAGLCEKGSRVLTSIRYGGRLFRDCVYNPSATSTPGRLLAGCRATAWARSGCQYERYRKRRRP